MEECPQKIAYLVDKDKAKTESCSVAKVFTGYSTNDTLVSDGTGEGRAESQTPELPGQEVTAVSTGGTRL